MIVTCPACDIRYSVPDMQLGGSAGRQVRCANCGNVWRYSAEAAAIHAAIAETAAGRERTASLMPNALSALSASPSGLSESALPASPALGGASGLVAERDPPLPPRGGIAEVLTAPPPDPAPMPDTAAVASLTRPSVAVELPSGARRRQRYVIEFVLVFVIFLIAALFLGAVFARDRIAQLVPRLGPVLASLNVIEPPTAGLSVTVSASRSGDALAIDGDITNSANVTRKVPRLRVTLRNGDKADVDSKDIDAPVAQLAPGAKAHFTISFDHPNAAATSVAATFTTD